MSIDLLSPDELRTAPALRAYLGAVARTVGVGLESCTVDLDEPVSAYLAVDGRHPRFPDRDVALLWDERSGWAAAIEPHSGEDLTVLTYLGGSTSVPTPDTVARFTTAVMSGQTTSGQPGPPDLAATSRVSLRTELGVYTVPYPTHARV
ncbi:DUF6292 family protein [Amycolatopsis minnesotensis]